MQLYTKSEYFETVIIFVLFLNYKICIFNLAEH